MSQKTLEMTGSGRETSPPSISALDPVAKSLSSSGTTRPIRKNRASTIQASGSFGPGREIRRHTNPTLLQTGKGDLELDETSETWEGWSLEDDGAMDTALSREINPSGFRYSCCDETGEEADEGCTFDRHLATPARSQKKQRKA
ncbi:hypothetical protein QBC44DRAFT_392633 [Cladorrhinum sp. PSN332]|nr:hypothetical protein QBC44DRAFT_392633 [Cladorrhinum sp. PSN332]